MSDNKAAKSAKVQWSRILKDALDADTWGQALEAIEEYEKLTRMLEQQIPELGLTADERSILQKVLHTVALRVHQLQDIAQATGQPTKQGIKLEEVKQLQQVLEDLFVRPAQSFPIQLQSRVRDFGTIEKKDNNVFIDEENDRLENEERGTLLPPPRVSSGLTTISFTLERIGLKDAETYINPHITVLVADATGKIIESQDTPNSNQLKPNYVMLGHTIYIQTPLEQLVQHQYCIFFEFKHYKPKKKKISTRCFALMEVDEIKRAAGTAVCLELYKKPTDFTRKQLSLFTIKKLYLHLQCMLNKN